MKPVKGSFVSVDSSIIRKVASHDARLALALLNVSSVRFEFSEVTTNFFAVDYDALDIEARLQGQKDSSYLAELEKRVNGARKRDSKIYAYKAVILDSLFGSDLLLSPVDFKGHSVNLKLAKSSVDSLGSTGYTAWDFEIK